MTDLDRMVEAMRDTYQEGAAEMPDIHSMAIAGLKALREPSEAMINGGMGLNDEFRAQPDEVKDIWRAMIDAVLSPVAKE